MSLSNPNAIKRALISVSDKSGLIDLAKFLTEHGIEILSTGGSAKVLADANIEVEEVANHTGFPEMLDGRVKTLHPKIHAGLLGRRDNIQDKKTMTQHNILPIDLVIVNLYPFEETVASGANYNDCIDNIDIGGPAMIRSAAKNHASVSVVVEPSDYPRLTKEMIDHNGATTLTFRKEFAAKAYRHTASYDAAIGNWFSNILKIPYPDRLNFSGKLKQELRYGENPHQTAAFYTNDDNRAGIATAIQIQGKELSFNNLNDTDAAFELVAEFKNTACAIIKHANPCGVAISNTQKSAYLKALACDPESAFGGIVALNQPLDGATAEEIAKLFAEVIIAPEITKEAQKILKKKKNLRVLQAGGLPNISASNITIRTLAGGYLIQERDATVTHDEFKIVTKRSPTKEEIIDLIFAFTVCKHVNPMQLFMLKTILPSELAPAK